MGSYLHIENLYRNTDILIFKECWSLEKVDGTSTNIRYTNDPLSGKPEELDFYSGGCKYEQFVALFNKDELLEKFRELGHINITIYGEGFGGKIQGMSDTYGKELCFIAFDVKIGDNWLNVPNAHDVCTKLGLEFVPYKRIPTDLPSIDAERDADSEVAIRRGTGPGHIREGVILRPIEELSRNSGKRIIAKHKRKEFSEVRTPREVDPTKALLIKEANEVADEYVTEMRLNHVLQKMPEDTSVEQMGDIIKAMLEDIYREAEGEVVFTQAVDRAISKATARLFKECLQRKLESIAS
jgi:hypothetical protein